METPQNDGGFHESLRALREILTLDTPTTNLLKGDQYEHFRSEIKALNINLKREQDEVKHLQTQLGQSKNEIEQHQQLRSTLEEAFDALNKHKEALVAQTNVLKLEKIAVQKELQSTAEAAESMKETFEKQMEDLQTKLVQATNDRTITVEIVGSMEAKYLTAEKKVDELCVQIERMNQEIKDQKIGFEAVISSLEFSNKTLESARTVTEHRLKSEMSRLEEEMRSIVAKLAQESDEKLKCKKQLEEAEERVESLKLTSENSEGLFEKETQQKLNDTQSRQEELQQKLDVAIQEKGSATSELESGVNDMANKIAEMKTLLNNKDIFLHELQYAQKLSKKEESANQLVQQARIKFLEGDLEDAKNELGQVETKFMLCRGRLTEAERELAATEATIKPLEVKQHLDSPVAHILEHHDLVDSIDAKRQIHSENVEGTKDRKRPAEEEVDEGRGKEEMTSLKAEMMAKKRVGHSKE